MKKWHNPAERPQFVAACNMLREVEGVLTVGEWAVLVKTCLDAAVGDGARITRSHCEVMADMDILTDAEGIGGFYPICDRCDKEMVRDCECPEDEDEGC